MKTSRKDSKPLARLIFLLILIVSVFTTIFIGTIKSDASWTPGLAIDLGGGTNIILEPKPESGQTVTKDVLDQAIEVIRNRIDASGVAEADIAQQGSQNIVVGIPGKAPSDDTIKLISQAAHMRFRPVLYTSYKDIEVAQTKSQTVGSDSSEKSAEELKKQQEELEKGIVTGTSQLDVLFKDKEKIKEDKAKGTNSGYSQITKEIVKKYDDLDCSKQKNREGGGTDDPKKVVATCAKDGSDGYYTKYLLGPVSVEGEGISNAQSGLKGTQTGGTTNEWVVSLNLKSDADDAFIKASKTIKELDEPRNQFAIVLDGLVISAPKIDTTVNFVKGQGVEISGGSNSFTKEQATTLANQLSFGAMPMNFVVNSKEQVSATLGSEQLQRGILAGLIGLLLVVLYSIYQYHFLGIVTIGSLFISATITYGVVSLLSWWQGYRLSLAGVIGLIVSIGITADSFIVFFERIRDELRDSRPLQSAVPRAWKRALRTIIASDTVNFLAALVLYLLAVGDVRGFAFTLGLTTIIDLFIVILFTFPVVTLLSRRRFFYAGHPMSGLSAYRLGAIEAKPWQKLSKEEKHELVLQKLALRDEKRVAKEADRQRRELASFNNRLEKMNRLENIGDKKSINKLMAMNLSDYKIGKKLDKKSNKNVKDDSDSISDEPDENGDGE